MNKKVIIVSLAIICLTTNLYFPIVEATHIKEPKNYLNVTSSQGIEYQMPAWVRHLAWWWAQGEIDTYDYVNSLQWLIDKDILKIHGVK